MELSTKSISQSNDLESRSFSDKLYSHDDEHQPNFQSPDKLYSRDEEHQPNFQSDENNDVTISPQSDFKYLCSLSSKKPENGNEIEPIIPKNKELVVELCDFMICSQQNCDLLGYKMYRKKQKIHEIKQKETEQNFYSRKKGVIFDEESDEEDAFDIDQAISDKEVNDIEIIPSDHKISDSEEDLNNKNDSDIEEISEDKSDTAFEENKRKLRKRQNKEEKVKVKKRSGRLEERKKRVREEKKRVWKKEKTDSDEDDSSYCDLVSSEEEDSDEENDTDFEESSDSGDSDWEMPTKKKRKPTEQKKKIKKGKKQKKVKKEEVTKTEPLSSFELARQKNVDDKMAFLQSLRMNELVEDLEETAKAARKKRILIKKEKVIGEASRKSKRTENLNINFSEDAIEKKIYEVAANEAKANAKQEIPRFYPFEDAFCGDKISSLSKFKKYFGSLEMKEASEINISNNSPIDLNQFDSMVGTSCDFPFVMSSIAFHPAENKTIILAGSSHGHISLWNPDTDQYLFAPHSACVSRIEAHPDYPHWIISSSLDGTLRLTDLNKECFVEILKENSPLRSFDFISPNGYVVSHQNGLISKIDGRLKRNNSGQDLTVVQQWESTKKPVNHIRVHPTKKDVCLSLDSEGFLKLWDLRKHESPIWQNKIPLFLSSADFSPVTGNSILCTSKITISIYDSSKPHAVHKKKTTFRLEHYAGSITDFNKHLPTKRLTSKSKKDCYKAQMNHFTMAKWLPSSDNSFIVTNNLQNKVLALNVNGEKIGCLKTSGTVAYQAVHPSQNILLLGNNPISRQYGGQYAGKCSSVKLYMEKKDPNIYNNLI